MESSSSKMNHSLKCNEKEEYRFDPTNHNKFKEIMSTIPRRKDAWGFDLYLYEGFWCGSFQFEGMLSAQEHFKPQPNQVILSSTPKSGTTWLKALTFAIMTRFHVGESTNPLLTRFVHDCVPFIEMNIRSSPQNLNLDVPLVATHIPYTSLPKSITNSSCKIVYICRDPKDAFVSLWHFKHKMSGKEEVSAMEDVPLEDALEFFCQGLNACGLYWDHLLGYWRASLESPEMILFLKYEDLKNETVFWVKKIAQFIGYPFSLEEENKGVVQKIIDLCSFEHLSSLEVNTSGMVRSEHGITQDGVNTHKFKNNAFFRKGKVGDWKNHLTPEMAKRLDQITEQKLAGSGLTLNVSPNG
ncbi:flavonol sulfotransferase-like [Castanea sativa]|uniref:flavonol sulfotransferase-like n=1 Tax=Castanea sativa TaxID=21020 RepID=UPI003F64C2E8